MVSRIAKSFQDYFMTVVVQKFGAKVFTDGLKQAMGLPYQEFEDQRSGETLSVLTKVRADTEKFIGYFVNILFTVVVGIVVVSVFAARIHWSLPLVYFGGIGVLMFISNLLSKRSKPSKKALSKKQPLWLGLLLNH
ncbi:ABC transporter transmembrane domain-containing protein [Paraflavitalea speifideaquila]|uniref:ABC transporter transmembrane domain-containing protein n=1 Tax=Paraflavitalea speifideaquila TaxID=3076558 RepID=UPI0028E8E665|nr:ABC transporter transmembrane domain-containing protein [Paraflavitalea speifideiaquila]